MKICTEYLHKPHSFYLSLSSEDKMKLLAFYDMETRREIYFRENPSVSPIVDRGNQGSVVVHDKRPVRKEK